MFTAVSCSPNWMMLSPFKTIILAYNRNYYTLWIHLQQFHWSNRSQSVYLWLYNPVGCPWKITSLYMIPLTVNRSYRDGVSKSLSNCKTTSQTISTRESNWLNFFNMDFNFFLSFAFLFFFNRHQMTDKRFIDTSIQVVYTKTIHVYVKWIRLRGQ